ncbi:MAG: sigma-54 interaction domain-containing protein [Moorellales bacterium]
MSSSTRRTRAALSGENVSSLEIQDLIGMIQNSYDAICIADGESRILFLNPAFERVTGLRNCELIGRRIFDTVREGLTDTAATLRVIETRKTETVTINTAAGRRVLSTGVPVCDPSGKIHRIYCNLRSLTDVPQEQHSNGPVRSAFNAETGNLFVTQDREMRHLLQTIVKVAATDVTVLILGETGVGKDLIARIIHEASPRKGTGLFVKVNCAAIPAELLESELFGYERGAFTGARREGKVGYFEVADRGTIFLDEIGDLSPRLQAKLLSVLQDRTVTRVGGVQPREVDVRVIAATNKNLEAMIRKGAFREDLYYRLSVVPIYIPPLRKRRDDVPVLIRYFADKFGQKYGVRREFSQEVIEVLSAHPWPGNVRELANLVERLIVVAEQEVIKPEHLPEKYRSLLGRPDQYPGQSEHKSLREALEEVKTQIIRQALSRYGSREQVAHKLGISLSTLTREIRKLKINDLL